MNKSLRKQIFNKALRKELDGCSVDNKEATYRAFDFIRTGKSLNDYLERDCSTRFGMTEFGWSVNRAYNDMVNRARMIAHSYGMLF